jgi:hypothetical protein
VHLRLPAIEPGVRAFIWAFVCGLYLWLFMLGVGVSQGTSLVLSLLAFGAFFLCIRLYGVDD